MEDRPDMDPLDDEPTVPHEVVRSARPPSVPADVFRRVFQASFGLSVIADGDGQIRDLSDAASALYASRRDALGASITEAPWWDEPDRVRESLRLARGGLLDRFYTPVTRDGSRRTFLVDVQSIDGPGGELWFLLEARDVTTLLASEHQLHDANSQLTREQAHLQAILDASPDALCAVDVEGRITHTNETWRRVAERSLATVPETGEQHAHTSHQSDAWARALAGEAVRKRIALGPEGRATWFDAVFVPVRTAAGRVVGASLHGRDVTAEVEAARLRVSLESANAYPFTIQSDGRIVSPAIERMVGSESLTLGALLPRLDEPDAVRAELTSALADAGNAVDLAMAIGGAPYRLRGRSVGVGDAVCLTGVVYGGSADGALATPESRWADLLDNAGWGGSQPVEYVRTSEAADPPDPARVAERVAALQRTALLDTAPSESFDALTRLASESLGVPVSLVSLVDEDRQFFKSQVGLGGPVADARETPLTHSFCQHVANERRPLVVADARQTPRLADNLAIRDLDVVAYLGVPVAAPDGHVIGALCAIDHRPHDWSDDDVRLLSTLAEAVTAEVAAHASRPPSDD